MALALTLRGKPKPLPWAWSCWALWAAASTVGAAGAAAPFKAPPSLNAAPPVIAAPPEPTASEVDVLRTGLMGLRQGPHSAALIDGAWVDLGQTARGARLVAITRQGAHLTHPDGRREFLALNPDAQWTPHTARLKEGRP